MWIVRAELEQDWSWGQIQDMSNRIKWGKLTDKCFSCLSLQFGGIKVPVREARRGCHHNIMRRTLIETSCQHTIHPAEIVTYVYKTFLIHGWLRKEEIHAAS